jgi:hypothetical protein
MWVGIGTMACPAGMHVPLLPPARICEAIIVLCGGFSEVEEEGRCRVSGFDTWGALYVCLGHRA